MSHVRSSSSPLLKKTTALGIALDKQKLEQKSVTAGIESKLNERRAANAEMDKKSNCDAELAREDASHSRQDAAPRPLYELGRP
jgi:hypothetical protein